MLSKDIKEVSIIGAGAWGTAMAMVAVRAGLKVDLWAVEKEVVQDINQNHKNSLFLAGLDVTLPPEIKATSDLASLMRHRIIMVVCPVQFMRQTLLSVKHLKRPDHIFVICSKGIEIETAQLPSHIIGEVFPGASIAVLSGPSFAKDVALDLPSAVTLAFKDHAIGLELCALFSAPNYRPYLSLDIVGAEIGGAIKNILAIGCGIIVGKKLGENAKAALITRGLSEMAELSKAMGGKIETMMGLAGLGDLTLTCNSLQSRNMSLGYALGQGQSLDEYLAGKVSVCEGLKTAKAIPLIKQKYKVALPICTAIYEILYENKPISKVLTDLMARPIREELSGF